MSGAEIAAVDRPDTWADVFDDRRRLVLQLSDAVCVDSHAIAPALVEELRAEFTEIELAELILVAGQANLNNRAGNAAKQLLGPAMTAGRPTGG